MQDSACKLPWTCPQTRPGSTSQQPSCPSTRPSARPATPHLPPAITRPPPALHRATTRCDASCDGCCEQRDWLTERGLECLQADLGVPEPVVDRRYFRLDHVEAVDSS